MNTDSFIESFTTPDAEEATSVDQLGMPGRNPFLAGTNSNSVLVCFHVVNKHSTLAD